MATLFIYYVHVITLYKLKGITLGILDSLKLPFVHFLTVEKTSNFTLRTYILCIHICNHITCSSGGSARDLYTLSTGSQYGPWTATVGNSSLQSCCL